MSSDVTEPPSIEPEPSKRPELAHPGWVDSTSGDELSLALADSVPDPLLGEFHAGTTPPDDPTGEGVAPNEANPRPPESAPVDALDESGRLPENPSPPGSYDSVTGAIESGGAPIPRLPNAPRLSSTDVMPSIEPSTRVESEPEDDDHDSPRATSLATLLLMSYASAVTIGLVWVVWTGRKARQPSEAEAGVTADARPDPGSRASRSRKVEPRPALLSKNLVDLGRTVKVGLVEVTPLGVSSGPVRLVRNFGEREAKSGGAGALKLRVKLRNASTDTVLAPLDEAFLRDRPGADPDTQIETDAPGGPITMYPLALESEWSIAGQVFRDLRPGQKFETVVVSAPDSASQASGPMVWRLRLRTDINHTDDVGVRFQPGDVKPEQSKRASP